MTEPEYRADGSICAQSTAPSAPSSRTPHEQRAFERLVQLITTRPDVEAWKWGTDVIDSLHLPDSPPGSTSRLRVFSRLLTEAVQAAKDSRPHHVEWTGDLAEPGACSGD